MTKNTHETRAWIVQTGEGYELTLLTWTDTLDRVVTIPAGTYDRREDILAEYPNLKEARP